MIISYCSKCSVIDVAMCIDYSTVIVHDYFAHPSLFYDSYLITLSKMSLLRTVSLRLQDQRLAMCLTDTSGTIDLHVNDYLVSSGFAQFAESAKDVPTQDLEQVCLCHKIKCCCVKNNQLYMCMYIGDVCI